MPFIVRDNFGIIPVINLALLIYLLATQIFDLLENELPADFNKKFGLSWNLLKSSIGSNRGEARQGILTSQTQLLT